MKQVLPEKYIDLFSKKSFAHLATLMPDGQPQSTPVWCDFDGTHVIINSAKGRRKDQKRRNDKRFARSIEDPHNPYRYLEVRGKVVEVTEQGADDHIHRIAKKNRRLKALNHNLSSAFLGPFRFDYTIDQN